MKKVLSMFLSLFLALGFVASGAQAATFGTNAVQEPGTGGSINGAFIKSTYGNSQYSMIIEDYFMKPGDARVYASKVEMSIAEGAAWLAGGFIPAIGGYVAVAGFISGAQRATLASKIRSYTDKGQSVHLTAYKDNNGTYYRVSYWDGNGSSVKPYSAPQPSLQKIVARHYK